MAHLDKRVDKRTDARPVYRFPIYGFLHLSSSMFFGRPRRSFFVDANYLLSSHKPRPKLTGIENLPREGAFVIVANHYQRDGLWVGWIGAMLVEAIYAFRPVSFPIRIVVTDAMRINFLGRSRVVPFSAWFLGRVAALWGMIRMPTDTTDTAGRAASLKQVLGVLRSGEAVLFFPEGERGNAAGLVEALPGTGTFLALAARRAKIIPAAFWEDGTVLRGHIAPAITLTGTDDGAVRRQIMSAVALLLPPAMRGYYTE